MVLTHGTSHMDLRLDAQVDIFAFIGGSTAADALLKQHPQPHKLKACLALDAKNLCVIAEDCDVAATVKECLTGTLSYNGQRCTALKLLMVHQSIAEEFVSKMAAAVDEMKLALPWEDGVKLTPLPEPNKPAYLRELIADAKSFGAKVSNSMGEMEAGPFVRPTVLYPCDKRMRVWTEEQFGPLIPIAPYNSLDDIYAYLDESTFGQQASGVSESPIRVGSEWDRSGIGVGYLLTPFTHTAPLHTPRTPSHPFTPLHTPSHPFTPLPRPFHTPSHPTPPSHPAPLHTHPFHTPSHSFTPLTHKNPTHPSSHPHTHNLTHTHKPSPPSCPHRR